MYYCSAHRTHACSRTANSSFDMAFILGTTTSVHSLLPGSSRRGADSLEFGGGTAESRRRRTSDKQKRRKKRFTGSIQGTTTAQQSKDAPLPGCTTVSMHGIGINIMGCVSVGVCVKVYRMIQQKYRNDCGCNYRIWSWALKFIIWMWYIEFVFREAYYVGT